MFRLATPFLLRLRVRLRRTAGPGADDTILWAAVIGVVGGLCSALFRGANLVLTGVLTGSTEDLVAIARSLAPAPRVLVPTAGGILAGIALAAGARLFPGRRSEDHIEVVRVGNGTIEVGPTLARLLSSLLSISSGSSIGREGGMVQLSALAASVLGRLGHLSTPKLRLLVACGGAAGIASAYNTPLAGAIFMAEIVLESLAAEVLGPLVVSGLAATLTIRHWIGLEPIFASVWLDRRVAVGALHVLVLGVLSGILSAVFLSLLDASKRILGRMSVPLPAKLGLGGLAVGLVSLADPGVWGNGHAMVESLLRESPPAAEVTRLLGLKVLATAVAVGTSTVGGVFTPTLFIGASVGWLFGDLLRVATAGVQTEPVIFAALGMGAFLAGTTHAPLTAILMIFEMTLARDLLFPLIGVAMAARYVSAAIRPKSVYGESLGTRRRRLASLSPVGEIVARPTSVVTDDVTAEAVGEILATSTVQVVWVVDREGVYLGEISLATMKRFLGDDDLRKIRAALVFMEDDVPAVSPDDPLTEALAAFSRTDADRLPVVDGQRRLLGEVTKTDLLLALG